MQCACVSSLHVSSPSRTNGRSGRRGRGRMVDFVTVDSGSLSCSSQMLDLVWNLIWRALSDDVVELRDN